MIFRSRPANGPIPPIWLPRCGSDLPPRSTTDRSISLSSRNSQASTVFEQPHL